MQKKRDWTNKVDLQLKWRYVLLLCSLVLLIMDQLTKWKVRNSLNLYEVKTVIPNYWNWTLAYNKGAAFSFLNNYDEWPKIFFGVIAFLVSTWIVNYILSRNYTRVTGIAMSLILGGAVGNLLDRIILGKVTDFIQWYYKSYYWPAFNFADSCIFIGVVILIIEGVFFAKDYNGISKNAQNNGSSK